MTDPSPARKQAVQDALTYADNIIATLREPFVVLDKSLRVRTANAAFYRDFHVSKEETEGRFVYDLGNGQWDIPQLRTLLPQVLSNSHPVEDFEVEHAFPDHRAKEHAAQRPQVPSREQRPGFGPSCHRGHYRPQAGGSRHEALRSPVSAAVPEGQGRHPHPRRRHGEGDRRQPVHDDLVGLLAR